MRKFKRTITGLCLLALAILAGLSGFCFGTHYGYNTLAPELNAIAAYNSELQDYIAFSREAYSSLALEYSDTSGQYSTLEQNYETLLRNPVTKEVLVPVEAPIELRNFESLEELRTWLGEERHFVLFGDLKCDGYALWLQKKALEDGYLMSFEAINPTEYNRLFQRMRIDELHAIDSVIIGKEFYYIEPQTMEIALGGYLN